ncbi:RHS repeat-associated core domain-containing protein [Tenacibaculum amylolyticum]|uniref:RHS repeat-associated core domain-containing protein n=1 Tax=Tenacibaculum amylolyticum TaxID=104269 RepID=UPI0038945170
MSTSKSRRLGAHFLWTLMLFTSFFPSPAYARSIFFEDGPPVMNTTVPNGGSVAVENVEMGTGNVSFHESLFSVEGYEAFLTYNSEGVHKKASTWNLEQKQGLVGLGWSYPENKVIRLTQQTGNTEDDKFLLYNEGNTYPLLFVSVANGIKEYRIAKQSDWVIKHKLDQDQWQFFHPDGTIYIYGDGNFTTTGTAPNQTETPATGNLVKHRSNSVEHNVKWGNWIGSSVIPDGQSRIPVAYNLSAIEDIYGEQVQLTYTQEEEQVGSATNSKRHTRATYLKEVKGLRNKTIRFTYGDKASDEYQDPHTEHQNIVDGTVDLTNDQDAYQERYERKYISKIGLYNRSENLQREVVLEYGFLKEGTALQKRMLTSINYNDSGEDRYKPATVFDYFGLKQNEDGTSVDGVTANLTATGTTLYNPATGALYGALKQQTLPDGVSYGYHYGKQQINGASKEFTITFPPNTQNARYNNAQAPWTAPELFYGTDYVVAIFESMDILEPKSYVKVYQWIGDRWIEQNFGEFDGYFYDRYRAKDAYTKGIWQNIEMTFLRTIEGLAPGLSGLFNGLNDAITDQAKTFYRVGSDIADGNIGKAIEDWFAGAGEVIRDVILDVFAALEMFFEEVKAFFDELGGDRTALFGDHLRRLYNARTMQETDFPRKVYHITMEKDFFALTRSLGGSQMDIFRKSALVPGQWDLSREVANVTSKYFTMDSGDNFVVVLDELTDFMYIYTWDGLIWNTDFTVLRTDFDNRIASEKDLTEDNFDAVFNPTGETAQEKAQHRSSITAKNNMILAVITDSHGVNADITIFHHDENMVWQTPSATQVNKKATILSGHSVTLNGGHIARLGELLGRDGNIDVSIGDTFAVLQTYDNLDENLPRASDIPIFGSLISGLTPDTSKINSTYSIVWDEDFSNIRLQHLHTAVGQDGIDTFIVGNVINKIGRAHNLLENSNDALAPEDGKNYAFRYLGDNRFTRKQIVSPYYTSGFGNDVTSALVEDTNGTYRTPQFFQFNPNNVVVDSRTGQVVNDPWSMISNASMEQIETVDYVDQAINLSVEIINVIVQIVTLIIPGVGELAGVAEETMASIEQAANVAGIASSMIEPVAKELAKDIIGTNHKSTSIANNFISTNGKLFNRQPNGSWTDVTDAIFTLDDTTTLVGGTNNLEYDFIPYTLKTPTGLKNYVKQLHNGGVYKSVELPFSNRVVHQDSLSATAGRGAYASYGPVSSNGFVTRRAFLANYLPDIPATATLRNRSMRPAYDEASEVVLHKIADKNLAENTLYDYPVAKVSIKQGNESLGYHHYRYGTDGIAYDSASGIAFYGKVTDIPSSTNHAVNSTIALNGTDDGYITHYYYNRYNAYGKNGANITGYPSQAEVHRIPGDQLVSYESIYQDDHNAFDNGNINVLQGHPYATLVFNKTQQIVSRDYTYYTVFEDDIRGQVAGGDRLNITRNYQVRATENVHILDGVIHRTVNNYDFIHHGLRMRDKTVKGTALNGEEELHKTSYVYASEVYGDVLSSNRLKEHFSSKATTKVGNAAVIIKDIDVAAYDTFTVNNRNLFLPKTNYKLANQETGVNDYTNLQLLNAPTTNLVSQQLVKEQYEADFIAVDPNSSGAIRAARDLLNTSTNTLREIRQLYRNLEQYKNRLNQYKAEAASDRARARAINNEITELNTSINNLNDRIDSQYAAIAAKRQEFRDKEDEAFPLLFIPIFGLGVAAHLLSERDRINSEIDTIISNINNLRADIRQKRTEIQEKRTEARSLLSSATNALNIVTPVDAAVDAEENAYTDLIQKLGTAHSNSSDAFHSEAVHSNHRDHDEVTNYIHQNIVNPTGSLDAITNYINLLRNISNLSTIPGQQAGISNHITALSNKLTMGSTHLTQLASNHSQIATSKRSLASLTPRSTYNYNWLATKTITKRDEKSGIAVAWKDADELDHSMLMDADNEKPVATFRGENVYGSNATTKYYHFDRFGNTDLLGGTVVSDGHSGESSATFGNRTIRPQLPTINGANPRYAVSGWIKNNSGISNATLTVVKDGDDDLFTATNTWQYFESILAIGDVPQLQTTNGLLIDDLLIRPVPVQVTMTSYDQNDLPALTINNNGRAIRHVYDDAQIPIAAIDDEGRVTGLDRHYYSREHLNLINNVLRFEPTESYVNNLPNSNLNIGVQDEGLYLGDKQEVPTNFLQEGDNYVISFTAPDDFTLNMHGNSIEYNTQNNTFRILEGSRDVLNGLYQSASHNKYYIFIRIGGKVFVIVDGVIITQLRVQRPTMDITFTGSTHDLIVAKSPIVSMQYYDGLSRPIQHQYYNDATLNDKIVSGIVYNGWGKPMLHTKSALVSANNLLEYDHNFINYTIANNSITGTLADYYNDASKVASTYGVIDQTKTNKAFTRTLYSNDPLQRKISVLEPGITDNTENKMRTGYQDQIGVALETAIGISSRDRLKFPTMSTEDRDRDQASVKDVFGRTVGTKDGDAETKFVYQYERNSFSTAETLPLGIATPAADFVNTDTKNDLLGDQMQTVSIDEGTTYMVKNRKGLPVFISENNFSAGDSNISWRYIAYDAIDRPVEAGTVTIPGAFNKEKLYFYANIPHTIWNFETNRLKYWDYDILDDESNFSLGRVTEEVRAQANGVASGFVEYDYKYNKRGQIIEKDVKVGNLKDQVIRYTYDASGKVKSITYPNNTVVTYTYDINGRLSSVGTPTDPNEYASYTYGVNGKMNVEAFDDGNIQIQKRYTLQEHSKQMTATTIITDFPDTGDIVRREETLFTESLEYINASGNYLGGMLLKRTEQITGQLANQWSYFYDNRYQLTSARREQLNGENAVINSSLRVYGSDYDVNGRITTKSFLTSSRPIIDNISYQAGTNKIMGTGISSNSIGLYTGIGTSKLGSNTTLQYDSFTRKVARITTNETSGFSEHMAFLYDANNNRVQKMVYPSANTRNTITYIWGNGTLPLYEKHETRTTRRDGIVISSTTSNESDRVFIYGKGYAPLAMIENNRTYYFIRDYQNSLRVVYNERDKEVEERYNYNPYGEITSSVVADKDDPLGTYLYTGQEYDSKVELYNFKARFYDPEKQIFLQPDPKHINYSPYTYANNNPVNFVDPSGEAPGGEELLQAEKSVAKASKGLSKAEKKAAQLARKEAELAKKAAAQAEVDRFPSIEGRKVKQFKLDNKVSNKRNFATLEGKLGDKNISLNSVSGEKGLVKGTVPVPAEGTRSFTTTFVGGTNRAFDTEVKLLEHLDSQIESNIYPNKGSIQITSELPYCSSCRGVINQFESKYPGIKVYKMDGIEGLSLRK